MEGAAMPEQSPQVSVITPTYNRADFLMTAIESVQAQTFDNWEMLIVDDGSTDDTAELVSSYATKDSRIRYFRQPNQGQSVARNRALEHARGEFVCFLDSDNAWIPEKLGSQLAVFRESPEVDVVYGDIITINEAGKEISRANMQRYSGFITLQMLKDNCVSMNTAMARRQCFDEMGGMSGQRRVADDYDLWLRFSARYRFRYIPEFLAYYRVMENQISSDKTARFDTNEAIIRDFREAYPEALSNPEFNQAFAFFYTRKGRYLATKGDLRGALRNITRALLYSPLSWAPWRGLAAVVLKRR